MTERSIKDKNCPRFNVYYGVFKSVIIGIVIAGSLAITGLDIAMLAGAIYTSSKVAPAVSLAAAILILIIAVVLLAFSKYSLKSEYIEVRYAFFADKIRYDDLLCVMQNSITGELYLVVKADGSQVDLKVNVDPHSTEAFLEVLRAKVGNLPVELFTPEKKH